jgi:ATP-dependent DNA helicase RecQ
LWHYEDVFTREFLIDSPRRHKPGHTGAAVDSEDTVRRKALEHRRLRRMIEYAETSACLRATILRYFGDPAVREPCDSCGSCRPAAIDAYDRELVRKILSGIARAGERYGRHRIADMLIGNTRDLPPALTTLSTTGLLRHETTDVLQAWLDALIAAGLVIVSKDQYRTLSLTERGRDVMRGRMQNLQIRRPSSTAGRPALRRYRAELMDALRGE